MGVQESQQRAVNCCEAEDTELAPLIMTTQPEALLEAELVQQLHGLGYERVRIEDEAGILSKQKQQLERKDSFTITSCRRPRNHRNHCRRTHPTVGRNNLISNNINSGMITGVVGILH